MALIAKQAGAHCFIEKTDVRWRWTRGNLNSTWRHGRFQAATLIYSGRAEHCVTKEARGQPRLNLQMPHQSAVAFCSCR